MEWGHHDVAVVHVRITLALLQQVLVAWVPPSMCECITQSCGQRANRNDPLHEAPGSIPGPCWRSHHCPGTGGVQAALRRAAQLSAIGSRLSQPAPPASPVAADSGPHAHTHTHHTRCVSSIHNMCVALQSHASLPPATRTERSRRAMPTRRRKAAASLVALQVCPFSQHHLWSLPVSVPH